MELRLEGKVVLVTGATQGIGRAIAETLAHSGAGGLLVTGREPVRGNDVATSLSQAGTPATFIAADLADTTAPARLVDECIGRFGRIDALVNAAGLTNRASFLDADLDDWAALFAVNARAPFFLMQAAITQMRKQGHGGAIVNILSINAHCGSPELAVYSATKGALATLTRNAANAHRFDRIRVNGINVGWTDTPAERIMQAETLGHGPGWIDAANASQPFGRLLAADEVANLAVFLLSDASGPMTGALIDQEQWVVWANR
ncbi:SDR family oxidoreductase [Mesorhizobium sp.]|uniref:SDR family oxidoreductase n=5 Tax=unclassified Mesorhizobium TaxID=325217 RepID=UPI000FEA5F81|nr:SDR family oxidoreductase [Mesorhizobium sp.]RWD43671.1 MAG: SDR family oxidoreductase [Mesorhizobium sp.]RWE51753.1 MAG: SDR family oxidoreductase [Mesorhizobium sp.]RWF06893.1 MAG: SDR family oxidoreductase [Mesorhizobium sp.]RWF14123.1 MAG: SDR family oxidoreductase [Mesorhizobium sp.]RWH42142.1 MAG: SDR family oxidoreductase [Mesorhizobium sp.]